MNYIIYLAHGDVGYLNECRFSLLRYLSVYNLQPPANTAFIIYTDQPSYFAAYLPYFKQFSIKEISKSFILTWLEGTGYIHRAKTKFIQEILSQFPGNIMFLDTDTFITSPLETIWKDIEQGSVYMHTSEGVVDRKTNPEFRKWDKFLSKAQLSYGEKKFQYSKDFEIWNTGVLGLSSLHAPVIDEVLSLIDSIYEQFPKHIAEQVAASYCFALKTDIKAARESVFHYWNLKEFRLLLSDFFLKNQEENIPNLIKLASAINVAGIQSARMEFEKLSLLQRVYKHLTGNAWKIDNYKKSI